MGMSQEEEPREALVVDSYRAAYAATVLTADETHVLDAAAALAGDAMSRSSAEMSD